MKKYEQLKKLLSLKEGKQMFFYVSEAHFAGFACFETIKNTRGAWLHVFRYSSRRKNKNHQIPVLIERYHGRLYYSVDGIGKPRVMISFDIK